MSDRAKSIVALVASTLAFTVCFAVWTTNGVLVTFLVDQGARNWNRAEVGWLLGIPVLTGALMRLPVGVLTDKYGGRPVYTLLMLLAAIPTWLLGSAESFTSFALLSLGFGLTGASFAVGIAFTSVWFKRERQGTALGVFGAGNAGAAITSMGAPVLLAWLTAGDAGIEGWRKLPHIYAAVLAATAVAFWFATENKKVEQGQGRTLVQRLAPLRRLRVWRFSLYYFFVFGGFVALAGWLIPYYVSAYGASVARAGLLAAIFTLPSGLVRALGGWMSDRFGARAVMYWVLGVSVVACALLCVPRMDIQAPGQGVLAARAGVVTEVTPEAVVVGDTHYPLRPRPADTIGIFDDAGALILPRFEAWQEPRVEVGDKIAKRELVARGVTHVYFQANMWVFTALVCLLGLAMGIGKAGVYKHIPEYFPGDVGVVGGIVGVMGGLGGFVCPILFGYILQATGIWTTCWMLLLCIALCCLIWMHVVVRRLMRERVPQLVRQIESRPSLDVPAGTGPAGGAR